LAIPGGKVDRTYCTLYRSTIGVRNLKLRLKRACRLQ
jgi:hypothetical protein